MKKVETLGSFIKKERKKILYTQSEFASLAGCLRPYISKIESDLKVPIKPDRLKSISKVISCDYKKLLLLAILTRIDHLFEKYLKSSKKTGLKLEIFCLTPTKKGGLNERQQSKANKRNSTMR